MLTDELKRPAGRKVQVSLSGQRTPLQGMQLSQLLPSLCCHSIIMNACTHMTNFLKHI